MKKMNYTLIESINIENEDEETIVVEENKKNYESICKKRMEQ